MDADNLKRNGVATRFVQALPGVSYVLHLPPLSFYRSKTAANAQILPPHHAAASKGNKRKADENIVPLEKEKRLALGNLTNKVKAKGDIGNGKAHQNVQKVSTRNVRAIPVIPDSGVAAQQPKTKPVKLPGRPVAFKGLQQKSKENKSDGASSKRKSSVEEVTTSFINKTARRLSNDFEKSENTLYESALEELTSSDSLGAFITTLEEKTFDALRSTLKPVPDGVEDFDQENLDDPNQVSEYAPDIFNYMKDREKMFPISNYMAKQTHLSKWMRSLLVDWMVEVQERYILAEILSFFYSLNRFSALN